MVGHWTPKPVIISCIVNRAWLYKDLKVFNLKVNVSLALMVRHWTPKPVIISLFLLLLIPLNTIMPFLPILYKLWKTRLCQFLSYAFLYDFGSVQLLYKLWKTRISTNVRTYLQPTNACLWLTRSPDKSRPLSLE